MTIDIKTVSANIRTLRTMVGLSREEFAKRVGVTRGVIDNLELGRLQSLDTKAPLLALVAKEFGVSLDWLMNGTGDPELPDVTDGERRAEKLGELIGRDDPTTMAFLDFVASRSQSELELIAKQLEDFHKILNDLKE